MQEQLFNIGQLKLGAVKLVWPVILFVFLSLISSPLLNKTTLLLGILYLLILHYKDIPAISWYSLRAYGLLMLMMWNLFSISWSAVPTVSTINIINDFEILFFAILAAYHARDKSLAESIKFTFIVVITLLALYCVIFPGDSMTSIGLKSFYLQKNNLGFTAGISTLVIITTYKKNWIDSVFLLISIVLLVLSQSKTSMSLVVFISAFLFIIYLIHLVYKSATVYTQGFLRILFQMVSIILYGLVAWMVFLREHIADYLIASIPYEMFTGRGLLWVTVLKRSRDDLLFGIGQGVFWRADMDSEIQQTSQFYQYTGFVDELISADGGYIDVIGGIGFIGLGLLLVAMIHVCKLNFKLMDRVEWKLYFSLIAFLALHNITETGFFKFTYSLWFILFLLTFYLIFKQVELKKNNI